MVSSRPSGAVRAPGDTHLASPLSSSGQAVTERGRACVLRDGTKAPGHATCQALEPQRPGPACPCSAPSWGPWEPTSTQHRPAPAPACPQLFTEDAEGTAHHPPGRLTQNAGGGRSCVCDSSPAPDQKP